MARVRKEVRQLAVRHQLCAAEERVVRVTDDQSTSRWRGSLAGELTVGRRPVKPAGDGRRSVEFDSLVPCRPAW